MAQDQTLSRNQLMSCLETEAQERPLTRAWPGIHPGTHEVKIILSEKFEQALKSLVVNHGHEPEVRAFLILGMVDEVAERSPLKAALIATQIEANVKAAREIVETAERKTGLDHLASAINCLKRHMPA